MALCWYSLSHSDLLYVVNAMQSTISVLQCVNFCMTGITCLKPGWKAYKCSFDNWCSHQSISDTSDMHINYQKWSSRISQRLTIWPFANGSNWRKGAPYLACITNLTLSLNIITMCHHLNLRYQQYIGMNINRSQEKWRPKNLFTVRLMFSSLSKGHNSQNVVIVRTKMRTLVWVNNDINLPKKFP